MKIVYAPISFKDIQALHDPQTLYVMDYRAISESMEYDIPAMRKYENILPRISPDQYVTVNEDFSSIVYDNPFSSVIVPKGISPKQSIASRLYACSLPQNIQRVYAPIPHPELDIYCKENNLFLQYAYDDFKLFNNKITQKKLVGDATPERNSISKDQSFPKNTFLKREEGSGGFTVFSVDNVVSVEDLPLYDTYQWYWEKAIVGKEMSVQVYKEKDLYTIFGVCSQMIEGNSFVGGKILSAEYYTKEIEGFIRGILISLSSLLSGYEGFLGVDFIVEKETQKPFFLEANVRMTAMTIPVLLHNYYGNGKSVFQEDVSENVAPIGGCILAVDVDAHTADVLW